VAAKCTLFNGKCSTALKIVEIIKTKDMEYYEIAVHEGNKKVLDLVNKGI
jgi:hypothetical protein